MGIVLADFLIEHLPFLQEDHLAIMDTVAVLLATGVLTEAQRETLWNRGKRQNSFYVAFLEICPDHLPASANFAEAAIDVLSRPDIQEVVSRTLDAIGQHYRVFASGTGAQAEAAARLGQVSADLTNPVFARSTAIGSLMRRKIEPLMAPILADLAQLRATA
jgi:hypothetical protein